MSKDKRIIFTVTAGRSGTSWLAHILKGLPDIRAEHEPKPGFHQLLPEARYDVAMAERFLTEKKLPYIHACPEHTYIETSHYFGKGFVEPLLNLNVVPDLVLLKRDPRKVACSWFLIGASAEKLHKGERYKNMLGPHEPNFLPAHDWSKWDDYQLCYWYALEAHARMQHYAQRITSLGGKTFEAWLRQLATGDRYEEFLAWLAVPEAVIRERVAHTLRQRKVNEKLDTKYAKGRMQALSALDLDALEAKVHDDCGLSVEDIKAIKR